MSYEHCTECDALTGRAGKHDDSLYHAHEGPFCVECYEAWDEKVIAERDQLREELAAIRASEPDVQALVEALEMITKLTYSQWGDMEDARVFALQALAAYRKAP